MAEEEVSYASVVFKSNQHPPPEAKNEETVYDEVKAQSETKQPTADTNVSADFLLDKKANRRLQDQRLACCLGILCVILLSVIIAGVVYFATVSHQSDESGLMAANNNLTNLINKLSLDNEKTMRDNNNLTVQLDNLTQNYNVLESKITNLTADVQNLTTQNQKLETRNQQLETQNQQLETQRNNLTEQIRDLETNWNKLNVSRAQWSIDAYCPKTTNVRQCTACQNGWLPKDSNCYAYNNAAPRDQKTWEEARQDCRGKGSDLVVVHSQEEKDALNEYSAGSSGTDGYWFGLRAEGGRWKWIDGSNLNESYWTPQPPPPAATDGQCVMSVKNYKWISVSCADRKQWICIKKALSV
ncbi:C-type lectin domain family 4 member G-like [Etheostoma cragini]|uniref:C-type lectin domain family 4 member G-like n=1 Tax=Etheostoma cragini TaxID=417921 RepID=UPI00155F1913|nr:C-type lectin domain family 4 member G-like [Etheostoma cragini]